VDAANARCGEVIGKCDEVYATTHFIADTDDPLWQYSDSAIHLGCFEQWEHGDEFDQRYQRSRAKYQALGTKYPTLEEFEQRIS
jgi:hypothetical protein